MINKIVSQHVVPKTGNKWAVQKGGSPKATKIFNSKSCAIKYATEISKHQRAKFVEHKGNGRILKVINYAE